MNITFQLALALTAAGSLYAAQSLESVYIKSQRLFSQQGKEAPKPVSALQQRDPRLGPVFERARTQKVPPSIGLADPIGKVNLASQLDKQLTMLQPKLGANPWYVGAAANSATNGFFITFMPLTKDRVIVESISYDRLKGNGQIVVLDEKTSYRVRLSPNIFDPVRGSMIYLDPVNGTAGASHKYKTGYLLDLTKQNSYVFKAKGKEFWLLYGTDIDEQNKKFADTRSFGFVNEAGMNTKVWTLPEAQVPVGEARAVALGDTVIRLLKTAAGELQIFE